jgi:hypothetical protein
MSPAHRLPFTLSAVLLAAALQTSARAQAPATPAASPKPPAATPKPAPPVLDKLGIKLIPQPGVAIPDADRAELTAGVAALGQEIDALRTSLKGKPELLALLPDVMIFHKSVDWALRYNEFFNVKQVALAKQQLTLGKQRAAELKDGKPSWISATGLVPRGYISKIDGSVQPYGMVIPEDWKPGEKEGRRLDFWAHGRGETLSELDFINQRLTSKGEFTPPGAFTLHLYGRYCCANKFAGEVDLFEALENAKKTYNIDSNKLVIRGFSMGGAAVWQFGTHFADKFAVVQPGAGFAETREFNKVYADGKTPPTWWEEVLYRWYDATDIVANLANTTTVAYSGEIDGQKQAADIMIRYARKDAGNANPPVAVLNKVEPGDGSPLAAEAKVTGTAPDVAFFHVIGPGVPHKIKPEAKPEVETVVAAGIAKHEPVPKKVRFATYSLIYPKMEWITVLGLERQWERAEVTAEVVADGTTKISTKNVSTIEVNGSPATKPTVVIDGQSLTALPSKSTLGAVFHKENGKWATGPLAVKAILGTKNPTLCGPIDHAFMSSFVFVKPTGKPLNDKVGAWVASEFEHATGFWRKVFRGETPVKNDTAITDADIQNSNLILWGDPSSNAVLKKIAAQLPVKWDAKNLVFAGQTYDATHTAPVLIFPNPLNPTKYIVLNSGPTFREDALLNNSQQIPKLPDWALVDINTPADGKWPGAVLDAGFFDEQWKTPGK